MSLRERVVRLLQAPPAQAPKTYPGKTLGSAPKYLNIKRDSKLDEYRNIYDQGGPISTAIDCYPLMMLSNGWRIEGERAKEAEQFLDDIAFEDFAWKVIVDALVVKVGYAEIRPGLDKAEYPIAAVDHRYPETFEEVKDDFGKILGYKQRIGSEFATKREVDVKVEDMFKLDLGLPLIARAYDDIMRDAKIADGTAKSIERHGFPRYLITVGQPGETVPKAIIDSIGAQFENLKPQMEMATPSDVKIENIDNTGVANAKLYGDWSTMRVCTALDVPEEFLGLGRGSTEATANVKLQAWYDKVGTLQRRFARQFNSQILERWAGERPKGAPTAAKLVFNDVSPTDESLIADLILKLTQASGSLDPFQITTPEWCRKRLGISEEEFQQWADAQAKEDVEQAKFVPPPVQPPVKEPPAEAQ